MQSKLLVVTLLFHIVFNHFGERKSAPCSGMSTLLILVCRVVFILQRQTSTQIPIGLRTHFIGLGQHEHIITIRYKWDPVFLYSL